MFVEWLAASDHGIDVFFFLMVVKWILVDNVIGEMQVKGRIAMLLIWIIWLMWMLD